MFSGDFLIAAVTGLKSWWIFQLLPRLRKTFKLAIFKKLLLGIPITFKKLPRGGFFKAPALSRKDLWGNFQDLARKYEISLGLTVSDHSKDKN